MTNPPDLLELYRKTFKSEPQVILELTPHGSTRQYFRLQSENFSTIGTVSSNIKENRVFIDLANYLREKNIPVPKVYAVSTDNRSYLQEDCGNNDLYSFLEKSKSNTLNELLQKAIDLLILYQQNTAVGWNYKNSYPFESFDEKEIVRDVKRFIEKLLTPLEIEAGEELKQEQERLISEIKKITQEDFVMMHRDFQARNILVSSGNYILIDFQNCRNGPRHYDLACLLFQSQIDYSFELREILIQYYIEQLGISSLDFYKNFYLVSVVRLIQSLGSYGVIGLDQGKQYYKETIPLALKNLSDVLELLKNRFSVDFPSLQRTVSVAIEKTNKFTSPLLQPHQI